MEPPDDRTFWTSKGDDRMKEFVCLDCGEDKTLEDMATESPALKHAITGQRAGSCKECYAR